MKSKTLAILTIVALCLALASALAPPLASPVHASPMQTLHLTATGSIVPPNNNIRILNLQPGDQVIQFTRPNLIVGSNPTGYLVSVLRHSAQVSGDLSGTWTVEANEIWVSWDELGAGNEKGYVAAKFVFDDGLGNTFSGILVQDEDIHSALGIRCTNLTGYVVSTSGTGEFSGQMLIGNVSSTAIWDGGAHSGNVSGTMTLRRYSDSEVSGPQPFTITGTSTLGNSRSLGPGGGPQPSDEFVQFTRNNLSIPGTASVFYIEDGSSSGSCTGALTGTTTNSINVITPAGTNPIGQGLTIGKFMYSDANGTINGVLVNDLYGGTPTSNTMQGYMFALTETGATGAYLGKEYYITYGAATNGIDFSVSGNLYTLRPSASQVGTATGSGTATVSPSSGTIQNLSAVSESALPAEGKPDLVFPHGFFGFQITGLTHGETVNLTITLPSAAPVGTQYWKYGPTPSDPTSHWYQIPMGDDDGDNVITITLVDGGLGDDDLTANGVIVDQGGPAYPPSGGGLAPVPVSPNIYIGIAAVLGAGVLAYFVRKRLIYQR